MNRKNLLSFFFGALSVVMLGWAAPKLAPFTLTAEDGDSRALQVFEPEGAGELLGVGMNVGHPIVTMGDTYEAHNGTQFILNDYGSQALLYAPNGTLSFGDMDELGNGTVFAVEDAYSRATCNVNMIFPVPDRGPVVKDSTNGHFYRIGTTNGALSLTDLGTTHP